MSILPLKLNVIFLGIGECELNSQKFLKLELKKELVRGCFSDVLSDFVFLRWGNVEKYIVKVIECGLYYK